MQLPSVVPGRTLRLVPGLLALAVVAAGCDQPMESPRAAAADAALSAGSAQAQAQVLPGETDLWKFAQEVPGFAGVSVDENGEVVVQVTDMAHASRARGAVAGILPHLRGRGVNVRAARHKFTDLAVWRDAAEAMLDETGWARSLDLDEARNLVVIEARGNQMRGEIMREAHRRGIPGDALLVTVASEDDGGSEVDEAYLETPYYSVAPGGATMLDGRFTTLIGGIAAGRRGSSGSLRNCNIGFIADLSGVRTFITTSSCSATSWAFDGGVWHQPYPDQYSEQYRVGVEHRDKRGESCGFLSPNVCRYSDATAIAIDAGVASERGRIARTLNSEATVPGSRQIDPNNPHFQITSTANPVAGQQVQKVGRATGWTRGPVITTCAVMYAAGRSNSRLRCQYRVNAGAEMGDSGSPVFVDNGDGTAKLLGMLWGMKLGLHYVNGQGYVISYTFSPFSGIQTDLGTMTVTAPSTYTPPPGGGGGGGGCTSGGVIGCEEMT